MSIRMGLQACYTSTLDSGVNQTFSYTHACSMWMYLICVGVWEAPAFCWFVFGTGEYAGKHLHCYHLCFHTHLLLVNIMKCELELFCVTCRTFDWGINGLHLFSCASATCRHRGKHELGTVLVEGIVVRVLCSPSAVKLGGSSFVQGWRKLAWALDFGRHPSMFLTLLSCVSHNCTSILKSNQSSSLLPMCLQSSWKHNTHTLLPMCLSQHAWKNTFMFTYFYFKLEQVNS